MTFKTITGDDWRRSIAMARTEPNEVRERIEEIVETICRECRGRGFISVEPNSTTGYRCPDCSGTGRIHRKDAA
jgi:DnaJ-class molecular chaperone